MNIQELFIENSEFFIEKDSAYYYHEKVHKDIIVHTSRPNENLDERNHLLDEIRPNESQDIKDYRAENDRQITGAAFRKFLSKCSRIIDQSNLNRESVSKPLKDWLATKPFFFLGEQLDLDTYTLDVLLRKGLGHSPNDLLVAFPYNPNDPEIPPIASPKEGGLEPNQPVDIKPIIIPFKDRRNGEGNLVFSVGYEEIPKGEYTADAEVFFGADEEWWYKFEPYYEKTKNGYELKYDLVFWYPHNSGISLLNHLPGDRSESWDSGVRYQETHIRGFFDFAADALHAYSDNFILRVRYSYPIPAIRETKCHVPNCFDGFIDHKQDQPCSVCNGTGNTTYPGPAGHYIIEDEEALGAEKKDADIIKYYNPDLKYAEHSFKVPFEFLKQAKHAIGLDLLDGTAAESGKAKDLRLEDLQDVLSRVATSLFRCVDSFLWQVECLLVPNKKKRMRPFTVIPKKLSIKDIGSLKEDAEKALPENRLYAHMVYYQNLYREDPLMLKIHETALKYTPYFVVPPIEMSTLMAKDIVGVNDLNKKLYCLLALDDIANEDPDKFLKMENAKIFELIDKWLEDRNLLETVQDVELYDPQGDLIDAPAGVSVQSSGVRGDLDGDGVATTPEVLEMLETGVMQKDEAVGLIAQLEGLDPVDVERILTESGF